MWRGAALAPCATESIFCTICTAYKGATSVMVSSISMRKQKPQRALMLEAHKGEVCRARSSAAPIIRNIIELPKVWAQAEARKRLLADHQAHLLEDGSHAELAA